MKILFIDDDVLRTKSIREALEVIGKHQIFFMRTAQEAEKYFIDNINQIDLIILDIMMPHEDIPKYIKFSIKGKTPNNYNGLTTGLILLKCLLYTMEKNKCFVPVIILTALKKANEYLDAMNVKVFKLIKKPIGPYKLIKEVKDVK